MNTVVSIVEPRLLNAQITEYVVWFACPPSPQLKNPRAIVCAKKLSASID